MDSTIRWGVTHSHPILMIPGPTELPFPVVQAMNQPATIQYDMNFDVKVLEPVTLALRDIFQTSARRGHRDARIGPHRARGLRDLGARAGRSGPRGGGGRLRLPHARDHDARGRRGHRARRGVGPAPRPGSAREGRRAREAQGRLDGPQRNVHRHHLSRRRGGPHREAPRRALHARHRLLPRRPRRAHRRVGRGLQHDRLAEVPRRAARDGDRVGEPRRVGGDGAPQAQGQLVGLRSPPLEGELDPHLPRRPDPRRQPAAAAGLDPDPPHPGPGSRRPAHPGRRPRPPLPPPRGRGTRVPRRRRGHAPADVPGRVARVQHGLVLQDAGRDRSGRGGHPHARPLRHPDRHRPRQDPHEHAAGRAHGHHLEPDVRAAHALRDRDDPA